MQEYLEAIVKPLLSHPEALVITKTNDAMGVLLSVVVSKEDMPHLIGKEGANVLSIRRLIGIYGMKNNARISIKINEPMGGKYQQV